MIWSEKGRKECKNNIERIEKKCRNGRNIDKIDCYEKIPATKINLHSLQKLTKKQPENRRKS